MRKFLIPVFVVVFIILSATFWLNQKDPTPVATDSSIVACTEEALMCPDGSYVAREGNDCSFRMCPGSGPFTGKLIQQGNGFFLVVGAPEDTTEEVSYSLPLTIKVSNALGTLVGKYVSAQGSFISGNTFEVTSLEEILSSDDGGEVVKIKMGESGFANGVRITLRKVDSDSRCPKDVKCITAGLASFEVVLKSDTDQETVTLATDKPEHPFDAFKVSIIDVSATPVSKTTIDESAYEVTFKVENL